MYKYRIILKHGHSLEMCFGFDFLLAMVRPGYFNGSIVHDCDRIWSNDQKQCILYGEIVSWELIQEPFDLEKEMGKVLEIINEAINRTPTGTLRNRLTDINIFLMGENEVIKKLIESEDAKKD